MQTLDIPKKSESKVDIIETTEDVASKPESRPWLGNSSEAKDPLEEMHAVQIPNHVHPGQEFLVLFLQSFVLKLRCPTDAAAGQTLLFIPPRRLPTSHVDDMQLGKRRFRLKARLPKRTVSKVIQARFYTSPNVQLIRTVSSESASRSARNEEDHSICSCSATLNFALTVPNITPTDRYLQVTVMGQSLQIYCSPAKKPGDKIYLQISNPWVTYSSPLGPTLCRDSESSASSIIVDDDASGRFQSGCSDGKILNMKRAGEETPTAEISGSDPSSSDADVSSHNSNHIQSNCSAVDPYDHHTGGSNSVQTVDSADVGAAGMLSSNTDPDPTESIHTFDAVIPQGVNPGGSFPFIVAESIRVVIKCPLDAHPGELVRFNLPLSRLSGIMSPSPINKFVHSSSIDEIKMVYKGRRWMRSLRLSDMKFIWISLDNDCMLQSVNRFDINRSAFVRKLESTYDVSSSNLCQVISFIPAWEASMNSNICFGEDENNGRCQEIFSARDISIAANLHFQDKVAWFRRACSLLRIDFFRGHVKFQIRRSYLLQDSLKAVMSLDHNDLRKVWRFSFIEEDAIDAGGVSREWFESVSKAMFDPCFGLWTSTTLHQNKMQINPSSSKCHDNDLFLFRFLGRVMGKALFDHHLISTHMVQSMYKNILGWPLTFSDLQYFDEEYYRHLKSLTSLTAEALSEMGLDFTIVDECLAVKTVVDLVPNGALYSVTSDNLPEYLEACWMHKINGRYKSQLGAFLLGFYDVIPEPLVTVFDFQELELVMCGVPVIDVNDWRNNTVYTGSLNDEGPHNEIGAWFWQLVEEMDQEMRARLLQFVTGCSGVPIGGFSHLQGNDGNIRLFTINGIDEISSFYPRSQ